MSSPWWEAGISPSSMLNVVVLSVIVASLAASTGGTASPLTTVRARRPLTASWPPRRLPAFLHAAGVGSSSGSGRWFRLPRSPLRAYREYDPYRRQRVVTGRDAHVQWWERARATIVLGIIVAVLGFALAAGVAALVILLLIVLEAAVG